MLNVLLFLWTQASGPPGTFDAFHRFTAADVHRIAAQLRANMCTPHRITVVTDLPRHEFCSDLGHLDLVQHFGELRKFGGCWLRLKCFAPELEDVLGPRWAWIDLDTLIVGDMDPLLGRKEKLVLYKSDSIIGQNWNGSFVLGGVGSGDIWTNFDPVQAPALVKAARQDRNASGHSKLGGPRGTDQAWLHLCRDLTTPHVSRTDGVLYWHSGRYPTLPSYARMVTFAGVTKFSNWRVRRYSPWVESFYPGPVIDPAGVLPAALPTKGTSVEVLDTRLGGIPGRHSILALERLARRRRKIRGGREFARG